MRKPTRGSVLVEFLLLAGLAIVSVAVIGGGFACNMIGVLTSIRLPLSGGGPEAATTLCASTEAVNYTRFVFIFVCLGTPTVLWVRNRIGGRRG